MGLWCELFGHDWRTKESRGEYVLVRPSDWCRNCGITKEDLRPTKRGKTSSRRITR